MKEKSKVSLRKAMHALGNCHHLSILIPGLVGKALEEIIGQESLPEVSQKKLKKIVEDLKSLEVTGKEADSLLKAIKAVIYKNINPDEVFIKTEE